MFNLLRPIKRSITNKTPYLESRAWIIEPPWLNQAENEESGLKIGHKLFKIWHIFIWFGFGSEFDEMCWFFEVLPLCCVLYNVYIHLSYVLSFRFIVDVVDDILFSVCCSVLESTSSMLFWRLLAGNIVINTSIVLHHSVTTFVMLLYKLSGNVYFK